MRLPLVRACNHRTKTLLDLLSNIPNGKDTNVLQCLGRSRGEFIIGERNEPPLSVELSEFSLYLYIYIIIYVYIYIYI